MAKRRKEKDEESEDKGFKAPKFDKEAFINKISKSQIKDVEKQFIEHLSGKDVMEREKAAKDLGDINPKYKNKTYNEVLASLDKESQDLIIPVIKRYLFQSGDKHDYEQERSIVEALIAINTKESAEALKEKMRWIEGPEMKAKATLPVPRKCIGGDGFAMPTVRA